MEVSTIRCKAALLKMSTSAPCPKRLKKNQVVTRWHFDAERRKFTPLCADASSTELPKARAKLPPSQELSVLTEGNHTLRQRRCTASLKKAQQSDSCAAGCENSEPRSRKANLLAGKNFSPTISLPRSPDVRFHSALPAKSRVSRFESPRPRTAHTSSKSTSNLVGKTTTRLLEEDPSTDLERTPEIRIPPAASSSSKPETPPACKRQLYKDVSHIHSQLFEIDDSDGESIGDDECEPSVDAPSSDERHAAVSTHPPGKTKKASTSEVKAESRNTKASSARKRKRSIAPASSLDQSTSKAKKPRLTDRKAAVALVTDRTTVPTPRKGSTADYLGDYNPESSEGDSESKMSHEESDVESEVEVPPKTPRSRSGQPKVGAASRSVKRKQTSVDVLAPKTRRPRPAAAKIQKTPAKRTDGLRRRKERVLHLPQKKEMTKPGGESNPFEIAKER